MWLLKVCLAPCLSLWKSRGKAVDTSRVGKVDPDNVDKAKNPNTRRGFERETQNISMLFN